MIFFLFLYFFPNIRGDCLEFLDTQLINECLIKESKNHDLNIVHYYPYCLRCTIQTLIKPENIQFEDNNQCLLIELQCIQIIFNNQEIFENFFQFYSQFISDLYNKDNGTDQNILHVIIKENTIDEINAEYIEKIFQLKYRAYRALFFELHVQNQKIKINRNLINITRLSMKIILVCGDGIKTIYIIHNRRITLENEQDLCLPIFIPSLKTISSSSSSSTEILPVSDKKSKDIILIIILLTSSLLGLLITFIIYCFKRLRRRSHVRLSKQIDTTSELSTSQDISMETPLTPNEKPNLDTKSKRPLRGMRAIQLLEDDI